MANKLRENLKGELTKDDTDETKSEGKSTQAGTPVTDFSLLGKRGRVTIRNTLNTKPAVPRNT